MVNKEILDKIFSSSELKDELYNDERFSNLVNGFFEKFIFGSIKEMEEFTSYQDPRFPQLKNQQIKSLFIELKEDKFKISWRNFISSKLAFSLGNYESYLTQGYQKHIHNLTKKFVNLENGELTFWVSKKVLLSSPENEKFVDEHRENQFKVLNHIMKTSSEMHWKDFFDLMDEARKCNVVTSTENTKLQPFQLESKIGEWKSDYQKSGVEIINLCNPQDVVDLIKMSGESELIIQNIARLRKRNFSGTKEILDSLMTIITKE